MKALAVAVLWLYGAVFLLSGKVAEADDLGAANRSAVTLRINLTPGTRYRTRIEVRTDESSVEGAHKSRYTQTAWLNYDSVVLRREPNVAVLRADFKSVVVEVGDGRSVTVFDSSKPRNSTGKPGSAQRQARDDLSNVVKGMAGASCTYSLSNDGKRLTILDLEASLQRMITRMKLKNRARDAYLKYIMRGMVKGLLGNTDKPSQMTGLYPSQAVGVGDSWRETYILTESATPKQCQTKFTLQSRRNGKAAIVLQGSLSELNSRAGGAASQTDVKTTGEARGAAAIEESTGWILTSLTRINSMTQIKAKDGQKPQVTLYSNGLVRIQSHRL